MSTPQVKLGGRVLELTAPHEITTTTHPALNQPEPGQVNIQMTALGLCGTDLHIYGGRGSAYPWVVGHDGVGIVEATGSGVAGLRQGQRVAVDPVLRCGHCSACSAGKVQLCKDGGYLGMLGPGLAAEYVQLPASQLIPVPDTVSDLAATVLEPIAVALHTLNRVRPLLPEPGVAAIIGGGPLGILQTQVMEHFGWDCVIFEPQQTRRNLAARLGLRALDPTELGEDWTLGNTPALVVETSAAGAGVDLAERVATPGSVIAVVGRGPHSVTPASMLLKELSVLGVKGGPGMYPEAVRLVAEGVIDPAAVISDEFSWASAAEAFKRTVEHPDIVVRSVLHGAWS